MNNFKLEQLKKAQDYANNKNGICLLDKYVNANKKLKWKCHVGHVLEASYHMVVNNNTWCPQCVGRFSNEYKIQKAQEHAESKGGKCLFEKYINAKTKLMWKCHIENHEPWTASYDQIINHGSWCPSWCPYCYKDKFISK